MTWWQYMTNVWWNFNQHACWLGTIQSDMSPDPLKNKKKSYSTIVPPSDMPTRTVKLYQAILLLRCQCNIHTCWSSATLCRELPCHCSCNKYACCPSATATNTAAVPTCLLVECCCKMDACWTADTQSACLPILCHLILHTRWCGASLSAIPAGVLPHYQPCLHVWCLPIGHAVWCGALLSAMHAVVLPHYRICMLVWCLTISHAFWCGASL